MNEEFAVDENGLTADGYHVLDPKSKTSMYLGNLIKIALLSAVVVPVLVFSYDIFADRRATGCAVVIALYAIALIYLMVTPQVFYRRYRYRLDDDKVEVRRGVFFVTHTLVPIERVHQVQVRKGPINKMLGLADVQITTAGGAASLEFLDESTAESIAARLNECVVKLLKERD